jgi:hypothetical protein
MATPVTVSVTVSFSPDTGQPEGSRTFSLSDNFDQKDDDIYVLSGAGTESVTLKTDAKVLLVKLNSAATAEINLNVNAGTDNIEISPGGCILLCSPSPSTGITAIDIVYTSDAIVTLVSLG